MKGIDKTWKEKQVFLFGLIKSKIPEQLKFIDVMEEILDISPDAVYRRVCGKTSLNADELHVLCRQFDISMDKILNYTSVQGALLRYSTVGSVDAGGYVRYFQRLSENLTELSKSVADRELFVTASDIPFYHFLNYPELLFFKLFVLYNILNNTHVSYKDFCAQQDKDSITPLCERMADTYMHLPTKEIWNVHTISPILQSLKYCAGARVFENKETILLLLKQLSELVNTVKKDAGTGNKGDNKAPFYLYVSPVDVGNNIMLTREGNKFNCDIPLFTVNSIFTDDESICSDIHQWINDLISKSRLVSTRLEQERCGFFQILQSKLDNLIVEIRSGMLSGNIPASYIHPTV
ncbi:MAG: hypothetical protein LBQ70_00605 [Prevotellaceae bacterium]|nr:hypothetical protein [Prevotellaceae bacterium]